jgi:hypothetical protein
MDDTTKPVSDDSAMNDDAASMPASDDSAMGAGVPTTADDAAEGAEGGDAEGGDESMGSGEATPEEGEEAPAGDAGAM